MSIATEIQRLQQAKADIKAAIEEKGVEVGNGTLDTYAAKISEITGGGGSGGIPTGYKTVTFMNSYKVEFERLVLSGDDCPDPLTQGRIETPTKESTVQYHYTYSGWTSVDGGTADSNVLKNITEDKVIYSAYTSTIREYTIKYYDTDGTTLLYSEQVAYGQTPLYTPEKSGFSFDKWVPDIAKVTGDASYSATWKEKLTFEGGAWEDIIAIAEAGQAEEYFAVGDKKTITASDGTNLEVYIIGFNHDNLADGTGKASMTLLSKQCFSDTMAVSDWETVASNMKTILKPRLPETLQNAIKPVTKLCSTYGSSPTTFPVTFDLFPLSIEEMKMTGYWGRDITSTDWYKYYPKLGDTYTWFADNYSAANRGPNTTHPFYGNVLAKCWMRQSVPPSSQAAFVTLGSGASKYHCFDSTTPSTLKTVQLAFCI